MLRRAGLRCMAGSLGCQQPATAGELMHACAMHAVRHACSRRAMQQQQQPPFFLLAAGLRSAGRASARNGRSEGGKQPGCMVHGAQPMHVVCFMVLVVLGAAPPPIGSSLKREFWPRKFPAPSCLPRPVPLVRGVSVVLGSRPFSTSSVTPRSPCTGIGQGATPTRCHHL